MSVPGAADRQSPTTPLRVGDPIVACIALVVLNGGLMCHHSSQTFAVVLFRVFQMAFTWAIRLMDGDCSGRINAGYELHAELEGFVL